MIWLRLHYTRTTMLTLNRRQPKWMCHLELVYIKLSRFLWRCSCDTSFSIALGFKISVSNKAFDFLWRLQSASSTIQKGSTTRELTTSDSWACELMSRAIEFVYFTQIVFLSTVYSNLMFGSDTPSLRLSFENNFIEDDVIWFTVEIPPQTVLFDFTSIQFV